MEKAIYFDMDGTLVDFYGVPGWLDYLIAEDATPYEQAAPRMSFSVLARYLNKLQRMGWHIGVISWLSKSGSPSFNEKVTQVKLSYLCKHMPSVAWDSIAIIPYGQSKAASAPTLDGILFDDEIHNRHEWFANGGLALDENSILEVLKLLASGIEIVG